MSTLWIEIRELVREALAFVRAARRGFALALAGLVAAAMVALAHDEEWLAVITAPRDRPLRLLARWLSEWGDYHTGTLMLAGAVALAGLVRGRAAWWRAALAALLAASFAGATANVVRASVGRPRPMAKLPDGLYGPNVDYRFQGFPSAHAATSFGTATALVVTLPALGAPALVVAAGVAWSRMHRRKHHPTDVFVGGALGALYGVALGMGARRRRGNGPRAGGATDGEALSPGEPSAR